MVAINAVVELERRDDVAVIWTDHPPINALSPIVSSGLEKALGQLLDDGSVRGIVIACRGRTFFAGADIRGFSTPSTGERRPQPMQLIERADKPVVAAIHGTALGGGLELALCCHARVAVASAQLGVPEVKLGILPGAGGTQRLPRVVDVEKALDMLTSGEPISAEEAHARGLCDELAPDAELVPVAVAVARRLSSAATLPNVLERDDKLAVVRGDPEFFGRYRDKIAARTRGLMAP